jgi:hypothetical protein
MITISIKLKEHEEWTTYETEKIDYSSSFVLGTIVMRFISNNQRYTIVVKLQSDPKMRFMAGDLDLYAHVSKNYHEYLGTIHEYEIN